MAIKRSKEWWVANAQREGDIGIGAGLMALDPEADDTGAVPVSMSAAPVAAPEERRMFLGRFVNLMRRQRGYSVEKLADEAELDAEDVLAIEADFRYVPEPRTVYKLAQAFGVPQARLMQLAGLAAANDAGFRREAVKFAARSESMEKLSPEESSALEAFVTVLSERGSKRV